MQICDNRGNYHVAHRAITRAIKIGILIRKDHCEVCGLDREVEPHLRIVGHHWRGYDFPLDVWWVCSQCNNSLHNRHDGGITIEEARKLVSQREHLCKRCFLKSEAGRMVYKREKKIKTIIHKLSIRI